MKYRMTLWHGESRSLYYIVAWPPEDEDAWEIVATYHSREAAEAALARYRAKA